MSVSAAKTKAPISSAIIAPINESVTFKPNNTIIFRIGPSDLLHFLVQDSYFVFDVDWGKTHDGDLPDIPLAIRNSSMFFANVRLLHAGNEVYYSQYNVAQQFLDYVKTGDDFINANYNEWCNPKVAYHNYLKGGLTPLMLFPSEWALDAAGDTINKKGYIMHFSQILKCFSQVENFPLKYLTQQIEIRLQLAPIADFVSAYDFESDNLYDITGNDGPAAARHTYTTSETAPAHTVGLDYTIKNMRLYMFGEDVDPAYDAVEGASNNAGQGTVWKYQMPRINIRNEPTRTAGYYITNFQCITENTDKLFVWAVKNTNLANTIRLQINNCNIRFGPYQLPKSPTAEDSWTKPAIYKALVDDTLEYSTAYYTSANSNLAKSYSPKLPANTSMTVYQVNAVDMYSKHDTHILIAGSYTTDDGQPGSNSKAWNSQYNLHYQLLKPETATNFVLAVDTDYVLTLRSGMLSSTNI